MSVEKKYHGIPIAMHFSYIEDQESGMQKDWKYMKISMHQVLSAITSSHLILINVRIIELSFTLSKAQKILLYNYKWY